MKNRGRISGHGLRVLAAIAFTMMIVSTANGDFSRQYAAAGGGWEYVYIGSVDSTYWFYNGTVRFGFDHGKGQWWHHGISWSILSGTGLSDAFIGDGATHSLNNGWWYSYAASIGGGYWNTGSTTRFSYDYTWGRWWSYSSWGAWRAMSAAGLSQAFIGDGINHDVGNGWWYAYAKSIDSGYWNSGAAVRFGYDYNAGQWWDHSTGSNTWLSLGDWAQTQAFIGDGVYHPLSNGWQYKYNKGVDRSYWMTGDKERFCYHYDVGRWWDWGTGWYELSAEGVSQSFIGDGAANNLFTGFNYQYDSGLDIGYWLLGAANRFSYAYGNGQWSHYGPDGVPYLLGLASTSARFLGDYSQTDRMDIGNGLGYWYDSLNQEGFWGTNWRKWFEYNYITGQWWHWGPTDTIHQQLSAPGKPAKFVGDYTGGADTLDLGNGFQYWYDMNSGRGYWLVSGSYRFSYLYGNGLWFIYQAGAPAPWKSLGAYNISAAFIGDSSRSYTLGSGYYWKIQYASYSGDDILNFILWTDTDPTERNYLRYNFTDAVWQDRNSTSTWNDVLCHAAGVSNYYLGGTVQNGLVLLTNDYSWGMNLMFGQIHYNFEQIAAAYLENGTIYDSYHSYTTTKWFYNDNYPSTDPPIWTEYEEGSTDLWQPPR